ncbi:hypothetical protein H4R35_005719 [Dimargaris xerosporica]|nr:hypothetical protein H4R35_005719 [Dimargaris xerosporica]
MGKLSRGKQFISGGFSNAYFQERIAEHVFRGYEQRADIVKAGSHSQKTSPSVNIVLLQKPIFIQNSDPQQPGCVLRGYVQLHLTEPTKFTDITLAFRGKLRTCWLDTGNDYTVPYEETKNIMEYHWTFLKSSSRHRCIRLPAGDHQYDFELVLPGTMTETVHTNHLSVVYKLQVHARRPGLFTKDLRDTEYVAIKRNPTHWPWNHLNALSVSNVWSDQIQYEVFLPLRFCTDDEVLDVAFRFIRMDARAKIVNLRVLLKEYAEFRSTSTGRQKDWTTVVSQTRSSNLLTSTTPGFDQSDTNEALTSSEALELNLRLNIPPAYTKLQYDTSVGHLAITHKVKCIMQFRDKSMSLHNICIAIPFIITPKTMEVMHDLPAYDTLAQTTTPVYGSVLPPIYEPAWAASTVVA